MVSRYARTLLALALLPAAAPPAHAQAPLAAVVAIGPVGEPECARMDFAALRRDPSASELRCRYGVRGPGRFGLAEYMDVPVYQPSTPLPGTHVVGVPGLPGPRPGESYEAWEWRVHRTEYGPDVRRAHRGLEVLHPIFAEKIMRLERVAAEAGIRASRRETWRSPERQAFLFQQGRSRPGPFATSTLTSWHSRVDREGRPAGTAVDYDVPAGQMRRFHQIVREVGLESYGADSNDPGHVYLPGEESVAPTEVAMLRMLVRVPVVTLATGRPSSETVTRATIDELRMVVREMVSFPSATPRMQMAISREHAPSVRMAAPVAAAPARPRPAPAR
ncbi:MAG TPA: hypothetical protein VGR37_00795 [Longimicrobiaceae bacterium]|nr:hypothetical protein [Longimicrobiaceae bacterium]